MQLDKQNGNTKWQEAVDTEYELVVIEYEAFIDKGNFHIGKFLMGINSLKYTWCLMSNLILDIEVG